MTNLDFGPLLNRIADIEVYDGEGELGKMTVKGAYFAPGATLVVVVEPRESEA